MPDEEQRRYLYVAIDRATRWVYNHHIPQRALHHQTPITTLKEWQEKRPDCILQERH